MVRNRHRESTRGNGEQQGLGERIHEEVSNIPTEGRPKPQLALAPERPVRAQSSSTYSRRR